MCECLTYDDGSLHLCECCAGMLREGISAIRCAMGDAAFDNNTAPSVPCGRCGSEAHQVPDCTAKVDDKLTVEGALGEAGDLMASFDDWKANDAMCSGIVNPYLLNVMRYVWAAAATRNLRVVEACETCKGNGHGLTCPERSQYSGYLSCCHGCHACNGTGRKT